MAARHPVVGDNHVAVSPTVRPGSGGRALGEHRVVACRGAVVRRRGGGGGDCMGMAGDDCNLVYLSTNNIYI